MKVCFDACVVVDILGATSDLKDSFISYDITCLRGWTPLIPVSTVGTIEYVLASRKMKTRPEAREIVGTIDELFEMIDATKVDCLAAYQSSMKDFEDALVAYAAARIGADVIVTRNKRDFVDSPVPAMTPTEFVEAFQPAGYVYELGAL